MGISDKELFDATGPTKFVVRCLDHLDYTADNKPTTNCISCKMLWQMEHNPEFPVCAIDLLIQQQDEGINANSVKIMGRR